MTLPQRAYWFGIGRAQQADCIDEPEHGRMNEAERARWWAGWWSGKALIPVPDFTHSAELKHLNPGPATR